MYLDLADIQIRASIKRISGDRIRLVLEYPREDVYRDKIMSALSELLKPPKPREEGGAADPSDPTPAISSNLHLPTSL